MSRRTLQLCIAVLTLALYVYLLGAYVVRGQFSWLTLPVLLFAVYVADAASGVAHFVVDYTPNTTGIGLKELYDYRGDKGSPDYVEKRRVAMRKINGFQEVVFDFKVHHLTPRALGRRSVLKMTLPVIVYATFPLTLLFVLLGELGWLPADVSLFFAIMVGCGTVAQYAHSCTHKRKIPADARFLQRTRLFLPPVAHEVHHRFPDRQFCLLNGWANPLIDRVFSFVLSRGYLSREGLEVI
jgi:hypothetical protein